MTRRPWLLLAVLIVVLAVVFITQVLAAPRGAPNESRLSKHQPHASKDDRSALLGAPLGARDSSGTGRGGRLPSETRFESVGGAPQTAIGTALVGGWASWYDVASGNAAAGPLLRTGDWRGRLVTVCAGSRCIVTRLTDWCACGSRHGVPTLLDLARADFARLAPPSSGIVRVTVEAATLPATDTAP